MSTQRRSVHFRELPRGQQLVSKKINHGNSTSLSQEPLLSPSAKSGKEMVLHSIFSPPGMSSTQGNQSVGRKRGTQCKQIDSCKDMASRMEFLTASQDSKWHPPRLISPTAETSPQNKVVDNKLTQTPQIYLITPQSSSEESKNSGNIVGTRSLRKDTSSTKHSIPHWPSPSTTFYSPAMSSVSGESLYNSRTLSNPTTPFSFMSCIGTPASSLPNSLSPNGLMPIEVFSVANIQNCNSIQGLEQIIEALKEQNGYPSLLRFAIRRLNEACHRDREANNQNSRTESKLPDMEICYQHTDEKNSSLQNKQENSLKNYLTEAREASFHDCTLNESSLMMSLSTDDEDSSVRSNRETKAILDKKQEFDSSNKAFVSRKCDSIVEAQLNDKLQSLTQTIAQMESARSTEKEEFARKIQQLEIIKDHADIKIKTLEATVKSAADTDNGTLTRENLLWSLQKLQQQKDRLQKNLLDERSLRDQKQKESLVLHHRLSKEIKDLQKQLSNVKTELSNRSRKSVELNTLLRSAQNNLLETKKERDDMVKCLLKLAGSDEIKIGKVS